MILSERYYWCKDSGSGTCSTTTIVSEVSESCSRYFFPPAFKVAGLGSGTERRQLGPSDGLSDKKSGMRLRVTLEKAEGLKAADWFGKSDPYCIVELGNRSAKSSVPPASR